jgi:hypothetical protein
MVPSGRAMLGARWHIAGQKSAKLFVANPKELPNGAMVLRGG